MLCFFLYSGVFRSHPGSIPIYKNKFLNKSSLNVSLIKLKILLNLLFELYIINGKVYFIGFPDFTLSKFSSLFYKFNIINFKSGIWVNGLLSNSIYMKKYSNLD